MAGFEAVFDKLLENPWCLGCCVYKTGGAKLWGVGTLREGDEIEPKTFSAVEERTSELLSGGAIHLAGVVFRRVATLAEDGSRIMLVAEEDSRLGLVASTAKFGSVYVLIRDVRRHAGEVEAFLETI